MRTFLQAYHNRFCLKYPWPFFPQTTTFFPANEVFTFGSGCSPGPRKCWHLNPSLSSETQPPASLKTSQNSLGTSVKLLMLSGWGGWDNFPFEIFPISFLLVGLQRATTAFPSGLATTPSSTAETMSCHCYLGLHWQLCQGCPCTVIVASQDCIRPTPAQIRTQLNCLQWQHPKL